MRNQKLPDPRIAFALALFFSGYGVVLREVLPMAVLLALALGCAAAFGVRFRRLFGRMKRLWQVMGVVALLQSLFAPSGTVLLALRDVPLLTMGGLLKGLAVLFRLALFLTSAALFSCYPPRALIQGMVQLRMPYEAAYMVSIGLRFVPQMGQALRDSLTALQLRGIVIEELGLRKRLQLYAYLLLPAVAASLQNARELAMSMEMRAFRAGRARTSYYRLSLSRWDIVLLCVIFLFTAVVAVGIIIGVIR